VIQLPTVARAAITAHAEANFPNEACGLLLGRRLGDQILISDAVPSANIAAEPAHRFEIDPGLRLRLQKAARTGAGDIVGHYHSHPNGAAQPSATDRQGIFEVDLLWLIAAVRDGHLQQIGAFMPSADGAGFTEVSLNLPGRLR
jgi:proteasome lid subunit RPN8/RPN11